MGAGWKGRLIDWKDSTSWAPAVSRWIRPYLNARGIRHLAALGYHDLCWDDPEWRDIAQEVLAEDIEDVAVRLGNALEPASVAAYHGCRTVDAGDYHRHGIIRNDPDRLADSVRQLVQEADAFAAFRPGLEDRIARFDAKDRDTGLVYAVIDDRALVELGGQYLIYGSEWVLCVLGDARDQLRQHGVPTIITVRLPLSATTEDDRRELASALLQEWARIKVNRPTWVPRKDFSFILSADVPASWVVGHRHPTRIPDAFEQLAARHYPDAACRHCQAGAPAPASSSDGSPD